MRAEEVEAAGQYFMDSAGRVAFNFEIIIRVPGSNTIGILEQDANILPKINFSVVIVPAS
jgi:hypothetical protein